MVDDPKLLARIQEVLVKMFEDMDKTHRGLNIPYFVYGGAMIDAIRYKSLIPWDDDTDILVTRRGYKHFLVEAPVFMEPKYRFNNIHTLPEYPYMFIRLGFMGTLLTPELAKNANYRMPICLDILPLDMVPIDPSDFKKRLRTTWLWRHLLYLTGTPTPMLVNTHGVKRLAIHTATSITYYGMKLLHAAPRRLQKLLDAAAHKYEGENTGRYIDFSMRDPGNWAVNLGGIQPTMDMLFNGITVQIASAYDAVMRRTYDEYVELLPVEQHRNRKPIKVDSGPLRGLP